MITATISIHYFSTYALSSCYYNWVGTYLLQLNLTLFFDKFQFLEDFMAPEAFGQ